jgi:hypothetical protein
LVWDAITALPQEKIDFSVSKPQSRNADAEKQIPPLEELETDIIPDNRPT